MTPNTPVEPGLPAKRHFTQWSAPWRSVHRRQDEVNQELPELANTVSCLCYLFPFLCFFLRVLQITIHNKQIVKFSILVRSMLQICVLSFVCRKVSCEKTFQLLKLEKNQSVENSVIFAKETFWLSVTFILTKNRQKNLHCNLVGNAFSNITEENIPYSHPAQKTCVVHHPGASSLLIL